MKKKILSLVACSLLATNSLADLKQDYTNKIVSGEIDPTKVSFDQFKNMNNGSGVDLKKEYTNKIISGEIDPTKQSFEQYKSSLSTNKAENVSTTTDNQVATSAGELNEPLLIEEKKSSSDLLEERFNNYLSQYNQKRISKGKSPVSYGQSFDDGKIILTGIARIPGNSNSKQWAKVRAMSFTSAYLNAMEKFALYQNKQVATKIGRSIFQDDSDDAEKMPEEQMSELEVLWNKVKSLAGAQLDQALEAAGVDPDKFKATPPTKRKALFSSSLTQKTITTASSHTRGFLPMKTYEGKGDDNTYSIGVICMYSHKTQQIAIDMGNQRLPVITKNGGTSLVDYVNSLSPRELLDSFGPRLMFDQNGEPAVISFGQWGYSYTGNNANKKERMKEMAKRNARSNADANIAMMLKGSMSTKEEVENSLTEENYMEQVGDGMPVEQMSTKLVDILKSELEASAKVNMPGTGTMKTWRLKHPNGQHIVGVVQAYTFSGIRGAKKTRTFVAQTKKADKPQAKKVSSNSQAKTEESAGYVSGGAGMEVDDF
ncbi:MAG: hypothetical protein U9Q04_04415 [Campylobacterota bacterium]|nr:hypothetical protein [Campylobacterota bacterium]